MSSIDDARPAWRASFPDTGTKQHVDDAPEPGLGFGRRDLRGSARCALTVDDFLEIVSDRFNLETEIIGRACRETFLGLFCCRGKSSFHVGVPWNQRESERYYADTREMNP